MDILSGLSLEHYCEIHSRRFQELLPELIKRLIINSQPSLQSIRIPSMEDIWVPGFDGIVECHANSRFVKEGLSVWEFGTDANYLSKITNDYNKRTANPRGVDMDTTTFYLVTTRIWASHTKTIEEWQNERTDWKAVFVYDAITLAGWMNSEPAVLSWFFEQIFGENDLGFETVSTAWGHFSRKTSPPFSLSMFLDRRDDEKGKLYDSISNPIIRVKADTRIESYGFVLAALMENSDLRESCIVINNFQTYNVLSSQVTGKVFVLSFYCTEDLLPSENTVIICFGKEAISIHATLSLKLLTKSHFVKAFTDMGLSRAKADELYACTHGSFRAIIRRIPGLSNDDRPDWIETDNIVLLVPVLFLRSFRYNKDRDIIEQLSGVSYETIENKYSELIQLEDSPIKLVDNYVSIVDYESTFAVLNLRTTSDAFRRLNATIISILDEINTRGKSRELWASEQTTIAHLNNLLLNYVYFSECDSNNPDINRAVSAVLPYAYSKYTGKTILRNMFIMAEAAPETVLEFLINGLQEDDRPLLSYFNVNTHNNDYTSILYALDELCNHEETVIKTCNLLFSLFQIDRTYNISNTPEESLLLALCLWHNFGILSLKKKKALYIKYIQTEPGFGLRLFSDALKKTQFGVGIRIGAKEIEGEPITKAEYYETIQEITEMAFATAFSVKDTEFFENIIESFYKINPDFLYTLAITYSMDSFDSGSLLHINYKVRQLAIREKKFHEETYYAYENAILKWIEITTPNDPVLAIGYLFIDYYRCPINECITIDNPFQEAQIIKEKRIKVIQDIISENGIETIQSIIHIIKNDYRWGEILAEALSTQEVEYAVKELISFQKINPVSALINNLDKATANLVFDTIPEEIKLHILPDIKRQDSFEWLTTPKRNKAFWSQKNMQEYDERTYYSLLEHYPEGLLLFCLGQSQDATERDVSMIMEVLSAIADKSETEKLYEGDLIEYIIENIEKEFYNETWAQLCFNLFRREIVKKLPKSISKYFYERPAILYNTIMEDEEAYFLLEWHYELPAVAYNDYDGFSRFFAVFLTEHNSRSILFAGAVLGKTKVGTDGFFPHDFTRRLLEEYQIEGLDKAVFYGKVNAFGMRTISDGEDQRILSEQYMAKAIELEIEYPHTANVLKKLSQHFLSEARDDYIQSELSYF